MKNRNPFPFLKSTNFRILAVAVILGFLATMLVQTFVERIKSEETGGEVIRVIYASTNITRGERFTEQNTQIKEVPAQFHDTRSIPAGDRNSILQLEAAVNIPANHAIMLSSIQLPVDTILSDFIRTNQRAVTLHVDSTNSFNNMLQPGDRIDILHNAQGGGLRATRSLEPLLQNVFVFAVGDRIYRDVPGSPTARQSGSTAAPATISNITVKLHWEDAIKLANAEANGNLQFLLRNRQDIFTYDIPTAATAPANGPTPHQAAPATDPRAGVPSRDARGLPMVVDGYPVIYQNGVPERSGFYPSVNRSAADWADADPGELQRRVFSSLVDPEAAREQAERERQRQQQQQQQQQHQTPTATPPATQPHNQQTTPAAPTTPPTPPAQQ